MRAETSWRYVQVLYQTFYSAFRNTNMATMENFNFIFVKLNAVRKFCNGNYAQKVDTKLHIYKCMVPVSCAVLIEGK